MTSFFCCEEVEGAEDWPRVKVAEVEGAEVDGVEEGLAGVEVAEVEGSIDDGVGSSSHRGGD